MVALLFWLLLGLLLLVYLGYPLITVVVAALRPKRKYPPFATPPKVAIVVAAYNEEAVIAQKLDNLLKLEYPKDKLDIFVASDGSTDQTNEIVRSFADRGIRLMDVQPRRGKTYAMNLALHFTDADIVVYTDADPLIERYAIQRMVSYFSDPKVGVVCGNALYGKGEQFRGAEQESVYWRVENWIKYAESRAYNSLVGGIGELFAVRRVGAIELPDNINHDIMVQVLTKAKGLHVLFEPNALAFSQGSKTLATEYRRKFRIVFQTAFSLVWASEVLNPFKHPVLAYQLWLHKVLRWFSGVWLFPLLPLAYLLMDVSPLYQFMFWLLAVFFGLAGIGFLASRFHLRMGPLGMPYYVCLVYIAALHGVIKSIFERPAATWTVVRTQEYTQR